LILYQQNLIVAVVATPYTEDFTNEE